MSRKDPLAVRMPFGKYKGRQLKNIPQSYLRWLSDKCDLSGDLVWAVPQALEISKTEDKASLDRLGDLLLSGKLNIKEAQDKLVEWGYMGDGSEEESLAMYEDDPWG